MGVSGAGSLYEMAATKLRDGFEQPDAMLGKLSLGRVRIFKSPHDVNGQRVILTIPVQKSPADEIEVEEIAVSVIFFNRTSQGEIVQLEDNSWVKEQWVTLPFDWAGGEESLRMTYTIPPQDDQTDASCSAGASYYGQVVSLTYKGEVLDVQAWPRDLAARIPRHARRTGLGFVVARVPGLAAAGFRSRHAAAARTARLRVSRPDFPHFIVTDPTPDNRLHRRLPSQGTAGGKRNEPPLARGAGFHLQAGAAGRTAARTLGTPAGVSRQHPRQGGGGSPVDRLRL